ncbi:beta-2 adrenergic receptor-like [Limulus polyphemus]|uniref:Beta-2 adrenergic receptor-like n=1 Tax=Limulus polyphemus TaxID=6850 RepID=A0ABM1BR80_LIMPO|nr:beta-2 adrenergic receptor-like [Limulus polyphemus]
MEKNLIFLKESENPEMFDEYPEMWFNSTGISLHQNVSDENVTEGKNTGASLETRILGSIICAMIIALTLLGNVLVILVVFRFRRLRSVTNLLLASLATADITVALLVMPLLVIYDFERRWRFGPIACHFWISCDVMCCTASILHLFIIALDRFWAITKPLRYRSRVSKKRVMVAIGVIWLCSGAISFIPIFMGWYSDDPVSIFVNSDECSLEVNRVYAVVSSVTSFYLPLPVMFYVYFRILLIAERQAREIRQLEVSLEGADQHVKQSLRCRSRQLITDTKAIRTLGIVMGVFCVCWLPFFLMYVILAFCKHCHLEYEWRSAITWLGYFNSSFNPCIYAFLNKEFKSAFRRVLGWRNREDSEVTFLDVISSTNRGAQRPHSNTMNITDGQKRPADLFTDETHLRDSHMILEITSTGSQTPYLRKDWRFATEADHFKDNLSVPRVKQSDLCKISSSAENG